MLGGGKRTFGYRPRSGIRSKSMLLIKTVGSFTVTEMQNRCNLEFASKYLRKLLSFDLKSLELFVRVAALGAMGRAGAEFNLSPTNATQRMQALEANLGVKLLNRTTRSVSLTPDGDVFLDHAKRIIDNAEEARQVLSNAATSASGLLRVTASATFGREHIVPFVPEFLNQHPDVTLDLNLSDMVVDIVEQGYEVAFRIGELAPSTLLAQKIDASPEWLVASPDYLEREGAPHSPADLASHACLPLGSTRSWSLIGPDGKQHQFPVSGPVTVNHGEAMSELVRAGLGIGQAALWHVGPHLLSGQLVHVMPDYKVTRETNIWAVRPPGRVMPARVKAFLDFFQQRIIKTNQDRYGALL